MGVREEVDKKNMTRCERYIKKYPDILNGYEISMSRKTSHTKAAYMRYVSLFLDYISDILGSPIINGAELSDLRPMDIDRYMGHIRYNSNGKENSVQYRNANLAAIDGLFKHLKKNGIIDNNPCDVVERPKDNKEHDIIIMEKKDIDKMLKNIENGVGTYKATVTQKRWKNRDKLILMLGLTTGLRVSALVGINIEDIDVTELCIKVVEKGNIEKKVYIGKKTMDLIYDWVRDRKELTNNTDGPLFICNGNKRMTTTTMENIIRRISGGKYTPHKMRATCATRLYEATGDIYCVQQQLGHKSIKNTERYAKVSEKKKKQSANILDSIF